MYDCWRVGPKSCYTVSIVQGCFSMLYNLLYVLLNLRAHSPARQQCVASICKCVNNNGLFKIPILLLPYNGRMPIYLTDISSLYSFKCTNAKRYNINL